MAGNKKIIKTGFCVAYDWELLKKSIPRVYASSDVICLAIDINRKSWAGNKYDFNEEAFFSFVREMDVEKKIDIYQDDFALPTLDKRENCNRHRMLIAERMGAGGWHIQVDADEYFLDFDGFVNYLKRLNPAPLPSDKAINICCPFVPLIKRIHSGYLYVNFRGTLPEIIPMATNKPDYQRARQNGHFNLTSEYYVIHETWARDENELWYKINNWGHAAEELKENDKRLSYYNLWKSLDQNNYKYIKNFHPIIGAVWPALAFCESNNIEEFIDRMPKPHLPLSQFRLFLANNRNVARLKSILK
ncbi:MAG: hypothetical protein WDN75_03365 [Bacteroidota bacterium]